MMQKDNRTEPRVRSRGEALLIIEGKHSIPATICDISTSGMRVETLEDVAKGLQLRIEVHGSDAWGVVRHCVRQGDTYQVGMSLDGPESGQ